LPKAASLDRRCSSAAFELIEETLGPVDIPLLDGDIERILLWSDSGVVDQRTGLAFRLEVEPA
jgi:hypothetical protein